MFQKRLIAELRELTDVPEKAIRQNGEIRGTVIKSITEPLRKSHDFVSESPTTGTCAAGVPSLFHGIGSGTNPDPIAIFVRCEQ
jgi:hypothetical protein